MVIKNRDVQKLDSVIARLREHLHNTPLRINESVETWRGKGWGMRFFRQRTETIVEFVKKDENDAG